MAKALFLAWTSPVDDASDSEFNAWYESTHIPQVRAAIPAITAVHRYMPADLHDGGGQGAQPTHRYLAVYEMDTDDVASAATALQTALGSMDITPTIDVQVDPPILQWYQGLAG